MKISPLLAGILLGQENVADSSADSIDRGKMWRDTIAVAVHWRVLPQLRSKLATLDAGLSESDSDLLKRLSTAAAAESALVCSATETAFRILGAAGIKAAAFKGIATVAAFGGGPASRMLSDADIMLNPEDVPRALECLSAAGFKADIARDMNAWKEMLEERAYRIHDYIDVVSDAGARLDIHWRIRAPLADGLRIDDILSRAVPQKLSRGNITIVSPADSIILTAHHSVRDRLKPASVVKDLCDIQGSLARSSADLASQVANTASRSGLVVAVLSVLQILARFDGSDANKAFTHELRGRATAHEIRDARNLAALFELQLNGKPVSDAVMGMSGISFPMLRRFASSHVRGIVDSKYRKDKYPGDGPPSARESISSFVSAVASITPARLRAYRSLAAELRKYSS
jgi:hypothetical protein